MSEITYNITIDSKLCTNCALCVAFCPVEVFDEYDVAAQMPTYRAVGAAGHPSAQGAVEPAAAQVPTKPTPSISRPELCWGCETCVGQCPVNAVHVVAEDGGGAESARERGTLPPLADDERAVYREWSDTLRQVLGLRWSPVAINLVAAGEPLPDLPLPRERLRYCQSLMAARRGMSIMMPANRHACPDGTAILGLTDLPPKLASGELYKLFRKLDSVEAARNMVAERPHLPARSIEATVVTPLDKAVMAPQVIAVFALPEQVMWLCMSASYYTGHRFDFHASGYNAQCVETTLLPLTTGKPNISFGCYGCRAASDVADELMFMGIPASLMPTVVKGLRELDKKAIPQSRSKIYLPPLM